MIRRLLIVTAILTTILSGVGFASHFRQFGYVGSRRSIGLRNGKLWYVWRVTPIPDGEGVFVGDAPAVNRAMYGINAGARWREEPIWPWLLGTFAAVAYSLILPLIRRHWKRSSPRWLIVVLASVCILLGALWMMSFLATFTFDGTRLHLRLTDWTMFVFLDSVMNTRIPWATGWHVYRGIPPLIVGMDRYFSFRNGNISLKVPLGILTFTLAVATIVLARPDRGLWPGYCRRCAYDLTGNVSGVCPECGTAI